MSNVRHQKVSPTPLNASRFNCPCCGYPTLPELNAYEICELCNWEDDGQDDETAEEVWGGSNSDYSLSEARRNFKLHRVMYEPGRDQRMTKQDSELEYETKGELVAAFERLRNNGLKNHETIYVEIQRLEQVLRDETSRQVREYERKHSDA
jgi:hypothetical protein